MSNHQSVSARLPQLLVFATSFVRQEERRLLDAAIQGAKEAYAAVTSEAETLVSFLEEVVC